MLDQGVLEKDEDDVFRLRRDENGANIIHWL